MEASIFLSRSMEMYLNLSQSIDNFLLLLYSFSETISHRKFSKKGMFLSVSTLCYSTGVSQTCSLWRVSVYNVNLVHEKSGTLGKSMNII